MVLDKGSTINIQEAEHILSEIKKYWECMPEDSFFELVSRLTDLKKLCKLLTTKDVVVKFNTKL